MEISAQLSNYRQAPRKVRIVADLVRGQSVDRALAQLTFLNKRAAGPMKKFIESAVANAEHNFNAKRADLTIKSIQVNKGITLRRFMPRAFGRAAAIRKEMSHVSIVLQAPDVAVSASAPVVEKKKRAPRAVKAVKAPKVAKAPKAKKAE